MAALLKKANAIDNEAFIRMLNPPNRNNLIHAERARQKQAAAAAAKKAQMGLPPEGEKSKKNGHAHP